MNIALEDYIKYFDCEKFGLDTWEASKHTHLSKYEIENELKKAGWHESLSKYDDKWYKY